MTPVEAFYLLSEDLRDLLGCDFSDEVLCEVLDFACRVAQAELARAPNADAIADQKIAAWIESLENVEPNTDDRPFAEQVRDAWENR